MTTFEELLAGLARSKVDYIVVGGLAVAQAGFVRVTDDVDLLVDLRRDNLVRLIGTLASFGDGAAAELHPDDFELEEGCIRVAEHFDVDLFTIMSGNTYADLLDHAYEREVAGEQVRFLDAHALINLKEGSVRPKDQLDVAMLRDILRRGE